MILYNYLIRIKLHVPCFLIISFYFFFSTISKRNIKKLKERIIRLYIPFLIYPLLIWSINNILYYLFHYNRFKRFISIYELIMQLLIGRKLLNVLWFHFGILFLTILFAIISFLFEKHYLFVYKFLALISYVFQYSNFNYNYFTKYNPVIQFSVGMLVIIIPISVSGLLISSIDILKNLKKNRETNIIIYTISFLILFKYNLFNNLNGFNFQGIVNNIGAILLFIIFALLPFEKIQNNVLIGFIKAITNYTGGIYYLHMIVQTYLKYNIKSIKQGKIFGCLIIYVISYFLSFLGNKILGKTFLKNLFI